jgi:anti-sigma regulatory factor (Ser/Thr protein kinase)
VTNSVLHAHLGGDDAVLVELAFSDGRLAITVIDPGSDLVPHLLPVDPMPPHGFCLHLVNDLSTSWGVRRNPVPSRCGVSSPSGNPGPIQPTQPRP